MCRLFYSTYGFLLLSWLYFTHANGMTCLQCKDGTVDMSTIPDQLRSKAEEYEKQLRTPECATATTEIPGTNVTLGSCTNDPGYGNVNKCGNLTGTLNVVVIAGLNIAIKITRKGCFGVPSSIDGVCLTDTDTITEQRNAIEEEYSELVKPYRIGDMPEGQLCIVQSNLSTKISLSVDVIILAIGLILIKSA